MEIFIPEEVWADPVETVPFQRVVLSNGVVLTSKDVGDSLHRCSECMKYGGDKIVLEGGNVHYPPEERDMRSCPAVMQKYHHKLDAYSNSQYSCDGYNTGTNIFWQVEMPGSSTATPPVQPSLF